MALRSRRNDVAQKRLRPLNIDRKIIVNKEDCDLSLLFARPRLQHQQFVHYALIRPKADRVAEESRHRAKFAAIRTAASRLDWNNAKRSPTFANLPQSGSQSLRDQ